MHISKFRLQNYKSYLDSGEISLQPGFNVLTGKNSAGKTALLDGLSLRFEGHPHRTEETVRYPGADYPLRSLAHLTLNLDRNELFRFIARGRTLQFPLPVVPFSWGKARFNSSPESAQALLDWLQTQNEFRLAVAVSDGGGNRSWCSEGKSFGIYPAEPIDNQSQRAFMNVVVTAEDHLTFAGSNRSDAGNDVAVQLVTRAMNQIYRFSAERFSAGESAFGSNNILAPNAQNLAEVLDVLQGNPQRFHLFNELSHTILPQIKSVSVRPLKGKNGQVEIIIWPHNPETMREDLAIPLNQCGSGVGQVLAILYVVLATDQSQVIIIDEPQSFLHPGAVRKLIEVLKKYPQHQYVLATHSPTVIASAGPRVLMMALLDEGKTSLVHLDISQNEDLRYSLADLGANLSDVFGADTILWVEGATEQECFPLIVREVHHRSLMGTAVIAIRDVGDLESRDAQRVFGLYKRLSHASTLLPPAIGFILDSECRSSGQKEELNKLSGGKTNFLNRRMYENYLLHPLAIAEVARAIPGFRDGQPISKEEIAKLIGVKRKDLSFYCRGATAVPAEWEHSIDAARVLKEIFTELSETRVSYEKTKHSVELTKWLLKNEPEALRELADLLLGILPVMSTE
jgi:predicted ATPase